MAEMLRRQPLSPGKVALAWQIAVGAQIARVTEARIDEIEDGATMGYRRFTDREGMTWEIRDLSDAAWEFEPVSDPAERTLRVEPPGHQKDPFELSKEELQRLLDSVRETGARRSGPRKSPFKD